MERPEKRDPFPRGTTRFSQMDALCLKRRNDLGGICFALSGQWLQLVYQDPDCLPQKRLNILSKYVDKCVKIQEKYHSAHELESKARREKQELEKPKSTQSTSTSTMVEVKQPSVFSMDEFDMSKLVEVNDIEAKIREEIKEEEHQLARIRRDAKLEFTKILEAPASHLDLLEALGLNLHRQVNVPKDLQLETTLSVVDIVGELGNAVFDLLSGKRRLIISFPDHACAAYMNRTIFMASDKIKIFDPNIGEFPETTDIEPLFSYLNILAELYLSSEGTAANLVRLYSVG